MLFLCFPCFTCLSKIFSWIGSLFFGINSHKHLKYHSFFLEIFMALFSFGQGANDYYINYSESSSSSSSKECVSVGFSRSSPPPDYIPISGQQFSLLVLNMSEAPFPPLESSASLPESFWGRPKVTVHGLTRLRPNPRFCFSDSSSHTPFDRPVPVSCFRSHTS